MHHGAIGLCIVHHLICIRLARDGRKRLGNSSQHRIVALQWQCCQRLHQGESIVRAKLCNLTASSNFYTSTHVNIKNSSSGIKLGSATNMLYKGYKHSKLSHSFH
eukprot:gnl/MRDRNA2_/MRDRNA2_60751_c0_seq1.p2 gnl/MRDRNA2_/MRDRNA2_60751_c0~~gnl/MRDRNA2_/MRDRNA2_60751_c0_seq1.p2  ORF type:complete len:105 (+),score=2.12 gnl/MRDRNA2_/MRDRNA2_60751_c0_seq1:249-563(+)